MKRLVGNLLAAVVLSGSVSLVAASPSSALPRDACMDSIHYWQAVSWYADTAQHAFDVWDAYVNASYTYDVATRQETWEVMGPDSTTSIFDYDVFVHDRTVAYADWTLAANRALNFMDTAVLC